MVIPSNVCIYCSALEHKPKNIFEGKTVRLLRSEHGPVCYECTKKLGLDECDRCGFASRGPFTKEIAWDFGGNETRLYCTKCNSSQHPQRYSLRDDLLGSTSPSAA